MANEKKSWTIPVKEKWTFRFTKWTNLLQERVSINDDYHINIVENIGSQSFTEHFKFYIAPQTTKY